MFQFYILYSIAIIIYNFIPPFLYFSLLFPFYFLFFCYTEVYLTAAGIETLASPSGLLPQPFSATIAQIRVLQTDFQR